VGYPGPLALLREADVRSAWGSAETSTILWGKRHAPGFRYNLATLADVQLQTFDCLALRNLNATHLARAERSTCIRRYYRIWKRFGPSASCWKGLRFPWVLSALSGVGRRGV
jgi:hypothetical protein